jgi:hypothetical protein
MKKLLIMAVVAVASIGVVQAQGYNWAVGVRMGGDTAGASVKYRMDASRGLEFLASSYWHDGFVLTGLYERYVPVIDRGFNFYYGAGAHLGGHEEYFVLGADGIVGLEYQFDEVPLALSLDWKPVLNIAEEFDFWGGDFALGVRITF